MVPWYKNLQNNWAQLPKKCESGGPLRRMLQVTYPEYRFSFIPVIVGAMGTVTIDLIEYQKTWIWWKRGCKNDENDLTEKHYRECKDL